MKIKLFSQPLIDVFKDLPVKACYLYGSQTGVNKNEESDYDIAVFVDDKSRIDYRKLLSKIGTNFLSVEKLHLTIVDLNSSSPFFLYQIIKNGKLLYEKRSRSHVLLESFVMRLYFDDQYRNSIYYQRLKDSYAR